MTISDVLMTARILLCSLYFFSTKVERLKSNDDHGESPVYGCRVEGFEDASERFIPQTTTPSTAQHPAQHMAGYYRHQSPFIPCLSAADVALRRIKWHLPKHEGLTIFDSN